MHVIDNHCISLVFICFYSTALTLDAFRLAFYACDTFDGFQWPGHPAWEQLELASEPNEHQAINKPWQLEAASKPSKVSKA